MKLACGPNASMRFRGDEAIRRIVFTALGEIGYDGWGMVERYPFIDDPDTAGRRARESLLNSWGSHEP